MTTLLALGLFAAGFAADQWTKRWALNELADGEQIEILPTVSLSLAFNPGVAFGLGAEFGPTMALGVLGVLLALTGWIIYRLFAGNQPLGTLLLVVVAAGGWGNMFDRLTRGDGGFLSGHVIDFIAVDWFAIFNFGDVLTVTGIVLWAAIQVTPIARRPETAGETAAADPSSSSSTVAPATGSRSG